jgi:hypothetical protein
LPPSVWLFQFKQPDSFVEVVWFRF